MIFNNYFNDILKLNPSFATFVGINDYNDKLEIIFSPEYINQSKKLLNKYLIIIKKIKNKNIYHYSLEYELKIGLEFYKYNFNYINFDYSNNIFTSFLSDIKENFFPLNNDNDLLNLIKRYSNISIYINYLIINLKKGIDNNFTIPFIIVNEIINNLTNINNKKLYYLRNKNKFSNKNIDKYNNLIDNKILKELNNLIIFFNKIYIIKSRKTIGLSNIKNGKNMYKLLIKYYLTLDNITEKEIYDYGLKEVKRIKNQMNKVKNNLKFKGSLNEFIDDLNKSKHYFKNKKDILKKYQEVKKDIDNNVIPKYFYISKYYDYKIKEIPTYLAKNSTGAYYYMKSIDNKRKGTFYLNTYNYKSNPKYLVESLVLHEGNPGHNYQLSYSFDLDLPYFLIYGGSTAYIEGWALYVESLGEYKDTYSYFGKLMHEMLRAARLVVDIGIHCYNWSYKKSVNYLKNTTGLSDYECNNEILRYISNPAQALSYKIGEKFILDLKKDFLKTHKNIKDFHNLILEKGAIPLKLFKLNE